MEWFENRLFSVKRTNFDPLLVQFQPLLEAKKRKIAHRAYRLTLLFLNVWKTRLFFRSPLAVRSSRSFTPHEVGLPTPATASPSAHPAERTFGQLSPI